MAICFLRGQPVPVAMDINTINKTLRSIWPGCVNPATQSRRHAVTSVKATTQGQARATIKVGEIEERALTPQRRISV